MPSTNGEPIDPFSHDGQNLFRERLRPALHQANSNSTNAQMYLQGAGPTQMDCVSQVLDKFPLMIGLTMLMVVLLIGVAFKSVVAPLRAALVLLWMLAIVFGLAIAVYQDGLFNFLHWDPVAKREQGGMFWMSVFVAFSIVVGLGLDYDIFYSERVIEERARGYSDHEAAVRALHYTANTISTAGLIMVLAFLALLVSSNPTLNEISFLLTAGILIDCFVSTKIVIPCCIALMGGYSFWPAPRKLKPADVMDVSPFDERATRYAKANADADTAPSNVTMNISLQQDGPWSSGQLSGEAALAAELDRAGGEVRL